MRGSWSRAAASIAGAAAFLAQASASADDTPAAPEVVVVTASHFERPSTRPSVDATVLTPGAVPEGSTLADLLATASDVEVQRPGAAGTASIFLRGAKPNFTLVMIEGIPLNDQTNSGGGSTDVSALNVLDLDRVEIVRGPLSSIYGSGAVQGAVNLILPDGSPKLTGAVSAAGGTDGDAAGALLLGALNFARLSRSMRGDTR